MAILNDGRLMVVLDSSVASLGLAMFLLGLRYRDYFCGPNTGLLVAAFGLIMFVRSIRQAFRAVAKKRGRVD